MKTNFTNNLTELRSSMKVYFELRLELVKLSVLEKMTKIAVFTTSLAIFTLASTIIFIFASAAFVVWYGNRYQDYLTGLFIVMGIVFLIMVLFYFLRKLVVETFFVKTFSDILFEEDEDEDEDDD